jgi:hypothetical protein
MPRSADLFDQACQRGVRQLCNNSQISSKRAEQVAVNEIKDNADVYNMESAKLLTTTVR